MNIKEFCLYHPLQRNVSVDLHALLEGKRVTVTVELENSTSIKIGVRGISKLPSNVLVLTDTNQLGLICTRIPEKLHFQIVPDFFLYTEKPEDGAEEEQMEPAGSIQGHLVAN